MRQNNYDFKPRTIGAHIKKKRLQPGLTQKQIAKRLSACSDSVRNWENGDHQPADAPTLQRIIRFLAYDPMATGTSIPDLLRAKRRTLGMGQRELALHLKVDPKTVLYWEQDGTIGHRRHRTLIARFLGLDDQAMNEMMRRRWKEMARVRRQQKKRPLS